MIAEAWAKRRYEAAFVSKINNPLGEAMETQSWLDHAYIDAAQFAKLDTEWRHVGGMLHRMTERAAEFCRSSQKSQTT